MKKSLLTTGRLFLMMLMLMASTVHLQAQTFNYGTGIITGNPTITGTMTVSGNNVTVTGSGNIPAGTYNFANFTVNSGVTLTVTGGTGPLIIRCTGTATINGVITAAGGNGGSGQTTTTVGTAGTGGGGGFGRPGGTGGTAANGCGTGGTGANGGAFGSSSGNGLGGGGGNVFNSQTAAGGGGAGYGAQGVNGTNGTVATGGFRGLTYGSATITTSMTQGSYTGVLLGGSGGGGGGGSTGCAGGRATGGGGGGGGGAIMITANDIVLSGTALRVNGGNGGNGLSNAGYARSGSGGGGSGGTILLQSMNACASCISSNVNIAGGNGGTSPGTAGGAGGQGRFLYEQDVVLCTQPTAGVTSLTSNVVSGTQVDVSFTRGTGTGGVLVIARQTASARVAPSQNTSYTTTTYGTGSGSQLTGTDNYVVYNSNTTGNITVPVTGLTANTPYTFDVYEYNSTGPCYFTWVSSQSTSNTPTACTPPTTQASGIATASVTNNSMNVTWTGNGNGNSVIVIGNASAAVNVTALQIQDNSFSAPANPVTSFTAGSQIGSGNYVLYIGTGSSVTLQNLTAGTTYNFAVFTFDNSTNCYNISTSGGNTIAQATLNPMTITSSTTTQNTASVQPNSTNQQIIGLQIVTAGGTNPAATVNSITSSILGSTSAADITNVRIFYTGTSSTFATTTQFGSTVANPTTSANTFTGSQALAVGTNYFWVAYDIAAIPTATQGNVVDANITSFNVTTYTGTSNVTPTVTAPTGSRQILLSYCTPSFTFGANSFGNDYWITGVSFGTLNFTGGTAVSPSSSPYYQLMSATGSVTAGQSYNFVGTKYGNSYQINMSAWADWNSDGDFLDTDERIMNLTNAAGGSNTFTVSNFTVPSTAVAGTTRIRVMVNYTSAAPGTNGCSPNGQSQGETKDFNITVVSATPMVYVSSTVTQNTAIVAPNTTNQQVIGLQVVTSGSTSPLSLTSITASTNGTILASTDITNAKIYYTGNTATFSATGQFGSTIAAPNGSLSFTGSQTLASGTNYFWLTYDVPSSATIGNVIDAEISSITVGSAYTPTVTAPTGARTIMNAGAVPIIYYDFESNSNVNTFENAREQDVNAAASAWTVTGTTLNAAGGFGSGVYKGGTQQGTCIIAYGFPTSSTNPGTAATHYMQVSLNTTGFVGVSAKLNVISTGTSWPDYGLLVSYDGSTWTELGTISPIQGAWDEVTVTFSSLADNNPNLRLRIYGYYGALNTNSQLAIDNFTILAAGTTTNAGNKTLPDFSRIYTSTTSGLTGSVYVYDNFTVVGSGTTINLVGTNMAMSGKVTVANNGTFNFGTASTPTYLIGAGSFTLGAGATIGITDNAGIQANPGTFGNIQSTGTRTFSAGADYNYIGGIQASGDGLPASISGSLTVNSGTGGVVLSQPTTVSGTINLTNGILSGVSNKLTATSTSTVNRTNGWVSGDFEKFIASGAPSTMTYEIGASYYTPVTLTYSNVTAGGYLTASTTTNDHPNIATSTINGSKSVNRYYTLSNPGLTSSGTYSAVFNFDAADVDGSAIPANFAAARYSGGTWSTPSVGNKTATSTEVTGLNAYGDFIFGETNCLVNQWTGAVDNDWFNDANWSCGTAPTAATDAVIPNVSTGSNRYPTVSGIVGQTATVKGLTIDANASINIAGLNNVNLEVSGNFVNNGTPSLGNGKLIMKGTGAAQTISGASNFKDLEINNSNGVTISSGTQRVSGILKLQAGQLTTNGNLRITSSASGTGLIDDFTGGSGTISGDVTIERYVNNSTNGFYYIGSPVGGANITDWGADFSVAPMNGASNGSQIWPTATCDLSQLQAGSPYGGLFDYRENAVGSCVLDGWHVRTSGNIQPIQGFVGRIPNGTLTDLTGSYTTGPVGPYSLTKTASNSTTNSGFNLVANPYASPVDWANVATANNTQIMGTAYVYQTSGPLMGTYVPVNGVSGSRNIASGQAFFVEALNNGSTISFANTMRTTGTNVYLRTAPVYDNLLTLDLSGNGYADRTQVAFGTNFTNGFDSDFDARKMKSRPGQPTMFTIVNAGLQSIYALPSYQQVQHIPVGLLPGTNGTYTINANDLGTFPSTALIYLEDTKEGTLQNLMVNPSYTFTADVNDNIARFILHFVPAAKFEVSGADCNGDNGLVTVDMGQYQVNGGNVVWNNYTVTASNGNVVASGTINNNLIALNNLPEDTYTISLEINGYTTSQQVQVDNLNMVDASFTPSLLIATVGEPIEFTNATSGANSFDWSFGDASTSSDASPIHAYSAAGEYEVFLVALNGECQDSYSALLKVEDIASGIQGNEESTLNIYGYGNTVFISFNQYVDDKVDVTIYDLVGRVIASEKAVNTTIAKHTMDMGDIVDGYYFVQVSGPKGKYSQKVFLGVE
ncbi:MAG: BNR-repeat neuraminidase N-terminal domain-containing protein [Chitinophagales bacterium]|nr:BNR-repeat neuraminidase N-terminal domain-containing protein [Chitinophagales bacterium]